MESKGSLTFKQMEKT